LENAERFSPKALVLIIEKGYRVTEEQLGKEICVMANLDKDNSRKSYQDLRNKLALVPNALSENIVKTKGNNII
jgi:hypothetical protein